MNNLGIIGIVLIGLGIQLILFLIYVMIIRWIFRINDIADALQDLAYYKKTELEHRK